MGDIAALGNANYLLIPLDEKPFEIDANSRVVTVPADFTKCGAVRNDNLCEIATFRIARYYDFQDLADCEIAIQWTNALGEEGLSWAFGKDVAGEPGYIRFGWALTEAVTKHIGNIKFAVRFFRKAEGSNKFDYLLNTLPAVITVKDTLSVGEDAIEEKNMLDLFSTIVINSQNPMYAQPVKPTFARIAGGVDFEPNAQAAIDTDTNTLELAAMAVTKDNSNIDYEWLYYPSDVPDKVINLTKNIGDLTGIGHDTSAYEINNKHYVKVDPIPETRTLAKYYIFDEAEGKYTLFTGEWDKENLKDKLYVQQTQLSFKDGDYLVTGQYQVRAISTLVEDSNNPNSSDATSTKVSILPPNPVEIQEDLSEHEFINSNLQVTIKPDPRNPALSYAWKKKTSSSGEFELMEDITGPGCTASEPGWYKVTVEAKLNRTTESETSRECFVTETAKKPVISKYQYKLESDSDWKDLPEDGRIDAGVPNCKIQLRLELDTSGFTEFNSDLDSLEYRWRFQPADEAVREITESEIQNNAIFYGSEYNSNELTVQQMGDAGYTFYCMITNQFQGQKATIDTEEEKKPFIIA